MQIRDTIQKGLVERGCPVKFVRSLLMGIVATGACVASGRADVLQVGSVAYSNSVYQQIVNLAKAIRGIDEAVDNNAPSELAVRKALNEKQNVLVSANAGTGISIDENDAGQAVISGIDANKDAKGIVQIGDNLNVTEAGVVSVPYASKDIHGVAKIGDNIDVNDGVISVPVATTTSFGVVEWGSVPIDSDGAGGSASMYVQF